MADKLFPDSSTNQNWAYLRINSLAFYPVVIVSQVEGYQYILKLSCKPLVFTSVKV